MERTPDSEDFDEATIEDIEAADLSDDPMIEPDADPLDTDVEDADLFLGLDDEENEPAW